MVACPSDDGSRNVPRGSRSSLPNIEVGISVLDDTVDAPKRDELMTQLKTNAIDAQIKDLLGENNFGARHGGSLRDLARDRRVVNDE